jgi:hypothetical protein
VSLATPRYSSLSLLVLWLLFSAVLYPTKDIVATTPATSTPPDAELRAILRDEVAFPEHVEIEFERVMQVVFAVR